MNPIYLDNNSTTVIEPDVADTISQCMRDGFVNPASQHQMGQAARARLENSRSVILKLLGASDSGMQADSLIFTSGGTESNNLALMGLATNSDGTMPDCRRVLVSAIEHPSISVTADLLKQRGFEIEILGADADGVVDLDQTARLLEKPARLVSVMAANNETGVIQPVREIARLCRNAGSLFHCDAVQAVGKIPLSFADLDSDAMTITAHKFHGPRGIGGLVLKHGTNPFPNIFGGFQQQGIRPGTEDVCLAAGFAKAVELSITSLKSRASLMRELRDQLERSICDQIPDTTINGGNVPRTPHTLNLSVPGINRQELLMAADMNGIAISTGSACASGSSDPSPVLVAMGLNSDVVEGSVRLSLSAKTTVSEIVDAADRITSLIKDLRR